MNYFISCAIAPPALTPRRIGQCLAGRLVLRAPGIDYYVVDMMTMMSIPMYIPKGPRWSKMGTKMPKNEQDCSGSVCLYKTIVFFPSGSYILSPGAHKKEASPSQEGPAGGQNGNQTGQESPAGDQNGGPDGDPETEPK